MKRAILIVPPGQVTHQDKVRASQAGYCVIECAQPETVRLLSPEPAVEAGDLAMAALEAIQGIQSGTEREKFTKIFYQRLKAHEEGLTKNTEKAENGGTL